MSRKLNRFLCSAALTLALFVSAIAGPAYAQAPVFSQTIDPKALISQYKRGNDKKIRILIVPGHDNDVWGTEFRGVKEADMTAQLGQKLYALLKKDRRIEPFITRTADGYAPEFKNYFAADTDGILSFMHDHIQAAKTLKKDGLLQTATSVPHNSARPDVALKLYGINKWADENGIDIIISIHFNDYPGRAWNMPGKYSGFTVYVPEKQYGNATASMAVGQKIYDQLYEDYNGSNLPGEDTGGPTPDQTLIAVGASNTLSPASALIEYGYIYESQFLATSTRNEAITRMAYDTYLGIHKFFGDASRARRIH